MITYDGTRIELAGPAMRGRALWRHTGPGSAARGGRASGTCVRRLRTSSVGFGPPARPSVDQAPQLERRRPGRGHAKVMRASGAQRAKRGGAGSGPAGSGQARLARTRRRGSHLCTPARRLGAPARKHRSAGAAAAHTQRAEQRVLRAEGQVRARWDGVGVRTAAHIPFFDVARLDEKSAQLRATQRPRAPRASARAADLIDVRGPATRGGRSDM